MPDFGQYTTRQIKGILAPKKGNGKKCSVCKKTLKGNQKLYFGGLCGKCLDKATKRRK